MDTENDVDMLISTDSCQSWTDWPRGRSTAWQARRHSACRHGYRTASQPRVFSGPCPAPHLPGSCHLEQEKARHLFWGASNLFREQCAPPGAMTRIFIQDQWFDLSNWAKHHPGGAEILQHFDGKNATDEFFSLHSKAAVSRLRRLGAAQSSSMKSLPSPVGGNNSVDIAYRSFRSELEEAGWFERSFWAEALLLGQVVLLAVTGTMLAWDYPLLASILLGLSMQQAGWLGHDMKHARNSVYCERVGPVFSGWFSGIDAGWWSNKHNTHHVLTNHVGLDPDIDNRPFIFLWVPPISLDACWRQFQHLYVLALYSLLYVSWRIQSLQAAVHRGDVGQLLFRFLPGYIWLACLPPTVAVGSILVGGFLVAVVVTLSHESEEMKTTMATSFVRNQFESTCDVECPDLFTEYLFGGMQYQLEHHLFPTLPRYKYSRLVPLVKKFAKENGLEYKSLPLGPMLRRHFTTLKDVGEMKACTEETSKECRTTQNTGGYVGRWRSSG